MKLTAGLIVVLLAGCGSGAGEQAHARDYTAETAALCGAVASARSGDIAGAGDTFMDSAHDGLHDLAAQVEEVDRAMSARLLEAKQVVEAGIAQGSTDLALSLEELIERTAEAVERVGQPRPARCSEGTP